MLPLLRQTKKCSSGLARFVPALCLLALGCSGDELHELELEDLPGRPGLIVAVELAGPLGGFGLADLVALEPGVDNRTPSLTQELDEDLARARFTAFHYEASNASRGIRPGSIASRPSERPISTSLLDGDPTVRALTVGPDGPGAWADVTELSSELMDVELPRYVCAPFVTESVRPDEPAGDLTFASTLADGSVLVGTASTSQDGTVRVGDTTPALFRLHLDRRLERLPPPTGDCPGPIPPSQGGFVLPGTNEAFLGGRGELWQVEITDTELRCLGSWEAPSAQRIRWIDGARGSDGEVELFLRSIEGAFERFDGQNIELIHQFAYNPSNDHHGEVAYLGRGRAVAVAPADADIVFYESGRIRATRIEQTGTEGWADIRLIDDLGLVAVTGVSARFFLQRPGSTDWVELKQEVDEPLTNTPDIVAFEGGFLAGAATGVVAQYVPDAGFCEKLKLSDDSIRVWSRLGERTLVAGGPALQGSDRPVIAVIDPCDVPRAEGYPACPSE